MTAHAEALAAAWRHHESGRAFEAASVCHDILRDAPGEADALHLLGVVAHRLGNPAAAVGWLAKSIAADAESARRHDDIGAAYRALGRLDEAEASHRRALEIDPRSAASCKHLGMVLRARGKIEDAIAALRQALDLCPGEAGAWYELGNTMAATGERAQARKCFRQAVALAPDLADAHVNLGLMLFEEGAFAEAATGYRRAVALDPDNAAAHNNLGNVCERLGDTGSAAACFERAAALDPAYVAPVINLGNLRLEQGDPDAATACYGRAIALAPDHVSAHRNLGLVQLMRGDFAAGWREWRWPAPLPPRFAVPEWRGEALDGATILLHAEQGFGDILHFVRYVPLVGARSGRVILEVPPELRRLLDGMPGAVQVLTCGEALPAFSWQCPLLSLPLAFGTVLDTIPAAVPYIPVPRPETLRPGPLRVGLVWAGRAEHNRDRHRSLPLSALAPLGRVPDVEFVPLQQGPAAAQAEALGASLRLAPAPAATDFADTAAAIAALDLVITVDTSVAHLAGAMGKPVWILISCIPDWRWLLDRADSPWYPTARLFRQPTPGDWGAPIDELAGALAALSAEHGTATG